MDIASTDQSYSKQKKKYYRRMKIKSCAFIILGSIILVINIILKVTGKNPQELKFFIAGIVFNIVMILSGVMGFCYVKTRKPQLFWLFIAFLAVNLIYRILGLVNAIMNKDTQKIFLYGIPAIFLVRKNEINLTFQLYAGLTFIIGYYKFKETDNTKLS